LNDNTKSSIRDVVPPFLLNSILDRLPGRISFKGRYSSWGEARAQASGYDQDLILKKVLGAALKVKKGEAVYERDSVLFDTIQYSFPVLAGLLRVALLHNENLRVLDFGGSLGSSYFQCRGFLPPLKTFRWGVVEQENFVREGKRHFEDENLKFFTSIEECLQAEKPDVILFSSVIQYLENPVALIDQVIKNKFPQIIIDMVPFHSGEDDIITVQHIPKKIYEASYPVRLFSKRKFMSLFSETYEKKLEFPSLEFPALQRFSARYEGVILDRK
jgi:putative methyltransferase (TIGR04325 family)